MYTQKDPVLDAHQQKEEERKNALKPNYLSTLRFLRRHGRHHSTFLFKGIAYGNS